MAAAETSALLPHVRMLKRSVKNTLMPRQAQRWGRKAGRKEGDALIHKEGRKGLKKDEGIKEGKKEGDKQQTKEMKD